MHAITVSSNAIPILFCASSFALPSFIVCLVSYFKTCGYRFQMIHYSMVTALNLQLQLTSLKLTCQDTWMIQNQALYRLMY
jgi:hypothetical protein